MRYFNAFVEVDVKAICNCIEILNAEAIVETGFRVAINLLHLGEFFLSGDYRAVLQRHR